MGSKTNSIERKWHSVGVRRISSLRLAQRIVVVLGLAAGLLALSRYLETIGHNNVSFGWFAYAPLDTQLTVPFKPLSPSVHLAIWAGASVVWALASLLVVGSALGRRIVLVLALAGALSALGQYLLTLGHAADRPGLQFLSSEQRAQYGGSFEPWGQLLIWLGVAVVWTMGAVLLLRSRERPNVEQPL